MKDVTLIIPVCDGRVLLGTKKRGFGVGKVTGFGGKLNEGESVVEAAVRELVEEVGLEVDIENLKKVAELTFLFPHADWDDLNTHVFMVKSWKGKPIESEEMQFEWHDFERIPFEKMWDDGRHWLPEVLNGRKIKGKFSFGEDNSTISAKEIVDMI